MEELYKFLTTIRPKSELERVAWKVRAAKHLLLSKRDPFRDHTAHLHTIKQLAWYYKIKYNDPEYLSGVEFITTLTGLTNDEIKNRTDRRTNSTPSST